MNFSTCSSLGGRDRAVHLAVQCLRGRRKRHGTSYVFDLQLSDVQQLLIFFLNLLHRNLNAMGGCQNDKKEDKYQR